MDNETTQFVWVYWHGGAQCDELRWSIRSVFANFQGTPEVLVVGDRAPYYTGPLLRRNRVRPQSKRGFRDVLDKIHAACLSSEVRDTFVWMMDDIYFIKPLALADLAKHYRGGKIPARFKAGSDGWSGFKADTFRVIEKEGLPLVDYCTHLPHVLEKEKWLWMWNKYGLAKRTLQWELLYGAEFFRQHVPVRKIRTRVRRNGATFDNKGRIGNNSNAGWSETLREELSKRFALPSPVESVVGPPRIRLVDAVQEALAGLPVLLPRDELLANPIAALDRFADAYDPLVSAEDYRFALGLVAGKSDRRSIRE